MQRPYHRSVLESTWTPPCGGKHYVQISSIGPSKVFLNDAVVLETKSDTDDLMAFLLGGTVHGQTRFEFVEGESYKLRIEINPPTSEMPISVLNGVGGCVFGFMTEKEHDADLLSEAVEIAKSAEMALIFVGHTPAWESEGRDQLSMSLPADGSQDRLIESVAKVNQNTVIINSTGVPINMPWLSDVKAVVQAWFPGQEAGHAIADVLLGKVNPAGRLPVTFPRRLEDAPAYANFPGDTKTDQVHYREGISIGYRFYDDFPDTVLFPFGYGLSYTTFEWTSTGFDIDESATLMPDSGYTVHLEVKNTGQVAGDDVVQVYVGATLLRESPGFRQPRKTLVGFAKAKNVEPGMSQALSIRFQLRDFASFDEGTDQWVVFAGEYHALLARDVSPAGEVIKVPFDVADTITWKP